MVAAIKSQENQWLRYCFGADVTTTKAHIEKPVHFVHFQTNPWLLQNWRGIKTQEPLIPASLLASHEPMKSFYADSSLIKRSHH